MPTVTIDFPARPYQVPVIEAFQSGQYRHAYHVWHRRAGKDRTAAFIESMLALKRVGLYWHALPEYRHARRVIWDALTRDGERLLDLCFPAPIVRKRNDVDMKIELVNGSIWQLVGADNFDGLVGTNPVHVTLSEFAIMHPKAREFIRPILAENNGTELLITTPRGYNHAYELWQYAKTSPLWHTTLLRVGDTGVIDPVELEEQRRTMPDELYRQEYECDWSAANVGSILGRYVELAEREGRVDDYAIDPRGAPIDVSCDIGFRDTAAFWFWQRAVDGYRLIEYDADSGLDAEEWIERLRGRYNYGTIYLPHDAHARTFASRRSVEEQFRAAGFKVKMVPSLSKTDRINAARTLMPRCRFHAPRCADGLAALREWSYKYNEETRAFSREPEHDWASHGGDAFSYGAIVMREEKLPVVKPPIVPLPPRTIGQMIELAERGYAGGSRARL